MQIAIAKRSLLNDPHCGDQGGYWQSGGKTILCIADGLGHGEHAERAAKAAVDYVTHHLSEPLPTLFAGCNLALRHTRGVAMGIAVVDEEAGTLTYAGIGNPRAMIIRGPILSPVLSVVEGEAEGPRPVVRQAHQPLAEGARPVVRLSSNYGIVGGGYRKLSPETMPLTPGDLVIMYTDGVPEMIDVLGYDDALCADVVRLAERIIQDWGRETDDAAVLVFRKELA